MAGVGDILKATVKGNIASADIVEMVFTYVVTIGTELDYQVISDAIALALDLAFAGMEAQISTRIFMGLMDLHEWDFVDNEFDGKATSAQNILFGTNAAASEPSGICVLMRFITEELRRQARKFVPGVLEGDVQNNALQSLILTPALASVALLNNDVVAGGVTLRPCTFNSTPLSPRFETESRFVQTAFVNALVGYQRRRQPGAGA